MLLLLVKSAYHIDTSTVDLSLSFSICLWQRQFSAHASRLRLYLLRRSNIRWTLSIVRASIVIRKSKYTLWRILFAATAFISSQTFVWSFKFYGMASVGLIIESSCKIGKWVWPGTVAIGVLGHSFPHSPSWPTARTAENERIEIATRQQTFKIGWRNIEIECDLILKSWDACCCRLRSKRRTTSQWKALPKDIDGHRTRPN